MLNMMDKREVECIYLNTQKNFFLLQNICRDKFSTSCISSFNDNLASIFFSKPFQDYFVFQFFQKRIGIEFPHIKVYKMPLFDTVNVPIEQLSFCGKENKV